MQDVNALRIPICRSFEALIPKEVSAKFAERDREALAVAQLTTIGLCAPARDDSTRTSSLPTGSTYDCSL